MEPALLFPAYSNQQKVLFVFFTFSAFSNLCDFALKSAGFLVFFLCCFLQADAYRITLEISGKLAYLLAYLPQVKGLPEIQISKRKEKVVSPKSEACLVQEFMLCGKCYTSKLIGRVVWSCPVSMSELISALCVGLGFFKFIHL